ncbi:mechanosensitive ion channel family protein [Ghiorsea bivora]|uniref:mechanosensitive ion channel family protein n=1 Tax=Ghiorsea bivora TaxID=1485545 RepID=UPI000570B15F|nr:mechanosensitive ion channel family protein [Ghiorsea bivora]
MDFSQFSTWMSDYTWVRWAVAATLLMVTVLAHRYLIRGLQRVTKHLAGKTKTTLDDTLLQASEKPLSWLILLLGIWASVMVLNPPSDILPLVAIAERLGRMLSIVLVGWFLWRLIDGFSVYAMAKAQKTDSTLDDQLVPFISKTLKLFLIVTGILVIAQNLGYSISGLVASLGIGGIAVAMAAKDTIANLFGSVMLLVDRPFAVGDWIKTSEFEGVVEEIGFRSTRIRTFSRTLVNVPNSMLANMVIDNIDARSKRRIKMRIGITYDTSTEKMQQAIAGIEKILAEHPGVDQEFSLVKFDNFEDSSLSIFLYYFSQSKEWAVYLQVRQEVNMQIMQLLETLGLEFAFPSRTLYIEHPDKPCL